MSSRLGALALCVAAVAGCTTQPVDPTRSPPPASTSPTPSTRPTATVPPPSPTASQPATAVSLPALMSQRFDGRGLRLGRVLERTSAYTRYAVTYESGRLTISGVMNVPTGRGPFPVVVLCHGYIDPAVYTTGRGLRREQDYLARRGFAVLHVDYRNHAGSDRDPTNELRLRLGYVEDVVNAVLAVRASSVPGLDRHRVALLGRSMGGGAVLDALVVRPGLVAAAVVFAPVSSEAADNVRRWILGNPQRRSLARQIIGRYGSPVQDPGFWRDMSSRTFVDRVTEPLLVHHGTADDTCPIAWSRATVAALRTAGKDVTFDVYPGEHHAFGPQWPLSMQRTVAFLREHLG